MSVQPGSRDQQLGTTQASPSHSADGTLRFDPGIPHPARIYAYWLSGKDYFEADRQAAEAVMRLCPQVAAGARANRRFLARVVRFLAVDCGIRQFLDVGTGLPAPQHGNTHEIARRAASGCAVVYCDNDLMVLSHARALLTSTPDGVCEVVDGDLRDPEAIVAGAAQTLDFAEPVAILLLAVLHFLEDAVRPAEIVAALASALAPGSYLAISHVTGDFAPGRVGAAVAAYNAQVSVPVIPRTHAQVSGLFGELPLVAPGVVPVAEWRPSVTGLPRRLTADLYAGVARIPRERK